MIEQLAERQTKLEEEIDHSNKKTLALEQINRLLTNITQNIPQQIIVMDRDTRKPLFMNDSAQTMATISDGYVEAIMDQTAYSHATSRHNVELQFKRGDVIKYLSVTSYLIEWEKSNAEAFVINDISNEKEQIIELESHAYRDSMTTLYNRFYGMMVLNQWLDEKSPFALVFSDLDNLKYINDRFGHHDGDKYIMNAAKHLKTFSKEAVVCRLGGDEFMLLVPNITHDEAYARMNRVCYGLRNDNYLVGKEYFYRISFGIVIVDENNTLPSSDILSLADERMYANKRAWKKSGRADVNPV
jgi:diguanylate cyclase (GGDEF)-like protein